jgi:hypothetical protein
MTKLLAFFLACLVTPAIAADSSITGTWATPKKVRPAMVMELASAGATVTGTIRAAEGSDIVMPILDGKIAGDRVTFKTNVPDADGPYPMTFTGVRSGNTIKFKCEVEVNRPDEKVALGPACVQSVTVRRTSR